MRLTLSAQLPFSLSAVVRSHGWVRLAPFGTDTGTGGLTYADRLVSGRVVEVARAMDSGELDLESLKTTDIPTAELRKHLLAIKGVGGYAVANLLMILGHYDFVPVNSWALKTVSREWYGGTVVGQAEIEASFEGWGEWKGLVVQG